MTQAQAQRQSPSGWQEDDSTSEGRKQPAVEAPSTAPSRTPSGNDSSASTSLKNSPGLILKGQVQHSEKLAPTPEELRPGSDFRASNLPSVHETSEWYRVPDWFAGTFAVEQSVVSKSFDYLTGQTTFLNKALTARGTETHGYQKDARGGIWQLSTTSGTTKSEDSAHIIYNIIDWYGPEEISDDQVVMRILANSIVISKKTGKVDSVIRREDIKTYKPLKPGIISVSYTSKSFTPEGIPHDLQIGYSTHKQISGFAAVNQIGDMDLSELFRQFLTSNNLANLIPKRALQ